MLQVNIYHNTEIIQIQRSITLRQEQLTNLIIQNIHFFLFSSELSVNLTLKY